MRKIIVTDFNARGDFAQAIQDVTGLESSFCYEITGSMPGTLVTSSNAEQIQIWIDALEFYAIEFKVVMI